MCAVQNKEGKWGFLNNDGIVKINYQFEFVGDFENGNAVVYNSSNKAGIIDLDGKSTDEDIPISESDDSESEESGLNDAGED